MSLTFTDRGPCPLCGAPPQDGAIVHAFQDVPVVRCAQCGFIHSGRVMTAQSLRDYYSDSFGSPRQMQGQQVNARVNIRALRRLLNLSTNGRTQSILDVGCGYGFLLHALAQRFGVRGAGVELSKQEADYAVQTLGLDVRSSLLAESGLPRASFDVVLASEVIEHIVNPRAFAAELAEYVKPGGALIIVTDNFESRVVRRMGPEFPKWIPHSHVSHFAPATLERCLASVPGLTIENRLSFTPWELVAKAARMFGRTPRPAADCYSIEQSVATETKTMYSQYKLRRLLSPWWFSLAHTSDLRGELMYVLARKQS